MSQTGRIERLEELLRRDKQAQQVPDNLEMEAGEVDDMKDHPNILISSLHHQTPEMDSNNCSNADNLYNI